MIINEPKELIADFVSQGIGEHLPWGNYNVLGNVRNDELVAGVVYNHYSYTNICAHIHGVGNYWLTRDFLRAIFDYPFNELGVQRITGLVPKKNKKARKFDEHLGFTYEGCMRNALAGDSLIIYGMLKSECRFI